MTADMPCNDCTLHRCMHTGTLGIFLATLGSCSTCYIATCGTVIEEQQSSKTAFPFSVVCTYAQMSPVFIATKCLECIHSIQDKLISSRQLLKSVQECLIPT